MIDFVGVDHPVLALLSVDVCEAVGALSRATLQRWVSMTALGPSIVDLGVRGYRTLWSPRDAVAVGLVAVTYRLDRGVDITTTARAVLEVVPLDAGARTTGVRIHWDGARFVSTDQVARGPASLTPFIGSIFDTVLDVDAAIRDVGRFAREFDLSQILARPSLLRYPNPAPPRRLDELDRGWALSSLGGGA